MKAVRDKLEVELHALERELTIDLPREIKIAVAMGDLRENAEYHAALDRQRYVRARIGQLHGVGLERRRRLRRVRGEEQDGDRRQHVEHRGDADTDGEVAIPLGTEGQRARHG